MCFHQTCSVSCKFWRSESRGRVGNPGKVLLLMVWRMGVAGEVPGVWVENGCPVLEPRVSYLKLVVIKEKR